MQNRKFKKLSILNLCLGYFISICFILLIFSFKQKEEHLIVYHEFNASKETVLKEVLFPEASLIRKNNFSNVIISDSKNYTYSDTNYSSRYSTIGNLNGKNDRYIKNNRVRGVDVDSRSNIHNVRHRVKPSHISNFENDRDIDVDLGILDRRLSTFGLDPDISSNKKDNVFDFSSLTVSERDNQKELGDLNFKKQNTQGYNISKGGDLYAYSFPSQGVGAGVGSSAVGAGAGGGAGLSAGIGQGIFNGKSVPTLGGVGDGSKSKYGEPSNPAGVGGLVGGAGAGSAAGLIQGYIKQKLGIGVAGAIGNGAGQNYDHLPENGELYIMIHVDGSGSILNTRKQLDVMKDTLLKDALLPYYNNSESLYYSRVKIISDSGERTLKFFTQASKENNVLAIAFQDEAQPSYHLPNFNKKPEDHYLDDITNLKSSLNNHSGIYRGIMFQVDRGKTFAKSFKEFVSNSFKGEGYLKSNNLKKYHRENNTVNIKDKNGIVFSDEYHAKDNGDPKYYLNLIFEASKRVGLDLNNYGGGLQDGKKAKQLAKD